MDIKEVKELIAMGEINTIDVRYVDLLGRMRHVTVASSYFNKIMEKGIGIDGSSIPGFASVQRSDMRVKPDLSTAFWDPFLDGVLNVFGDVYLAESENIFPMYPRHVLRKAVNLLRSQRIADDIFAFGELEFYIFKDVQLEDTFFMLEFSENMGGIKKGYHIAEPFDDLFVLRNSVVDLLEDIDIKVKYHHHEVGTKGQHEIELAFAPVLNMADYVEVAKYVIKKVAEDSDLKATFMPKPIHGEPGSGLHFHFYLFKNGINIFNMHKGRLNDAARFFIGGVLKHAKSLSAFTNPSTNSYKRLTSGFEAPTAINYSIANRTSAIRIPGYADRKSIDIEYRPPDATMNTYLGLAAIVMAGIDGILNKIEPGEPAEENVYENADKYERLPSTLCEALDALAHDKEYLLLEDVFTEDLIEQWIELKKKEYKAINERPVPLEYRLYF